MIFMWNKIGLRLFEEKNVGHEAEAVESHCTDHKHIFHACSFSSPRVRFPLLAGRLFVDAVGLDLCLPV